MKLLEFFELLLSVYLSSAFNLRGLTNDTLQQQLSNARLYSRIINGLTAVPNQFHYQVGLELHLEGDGFMKCGGSLISDKWVLTAAHCTHDSSIIHVYIGQIRLQRIHNVVRRPSPNVIEHDDYHETTMLNDIALIKILPVKLTDAIRPVILPFNHVRSYFHVTGVLAGWGYISHLEIEPDSLQYATFKVISNADCAAKYRKARMREGKLCATSTSAANACHGDSGGALVLEGGNFQIGILSFGSHKGCDEGYPLAFTRVDHYLDWIREKTNLGV